ncbi:MAG: tyrosine-type recombinase/integrase [Ruminococcaceae bacterium]|nr:tyrosine-type recombinase/integrase [Oscillospiraceae bacterium]
MANIRKIEGKTGTSYKITVTNGRDMNGKQMRHYKTWVPAAGMTQRQVDKELARVAMEFERQILEGFAADNRQTFAAYAEYVLALKERTGTKIRTIERYRDLLKRINPAIGHLKLADIRPQHLNTLYANLGESGIRADGEKAVAKVDMPALLKEKKITRNKLAELSGVSSATVSTVTKGRRVTKAVADAISVVLKIDTGKLFTIESDTSPLSDKTILEHHRLISTILAQAEKEMLVQYNAAHRATPPKVARQEAASFQPEEVQAIRDALEGEPLKWKTASHLLLVTGCRRGEIVGLKWDKVDWANNQIKIDRALLYSNTRGVYEDTTKTSTTRYIKLPVETMLLLKEYRQWYTELQLANGPRWNNTGYIFVQDNGKPMNPDSLTDWLRKFSQRHSLPHIHPHKFRHTMASLLYYNGLDSVTISKRLGHAKVSTTADIYSHIIKQADEKASECIADTILRNPGVG